jgi:thiol-disulfide isomerase/thioredoxin
MMLITTALAAAAFAALPEVPPPALRMGDPAPAMDIAHWVKTPGAVDSISPGDGNIYIIDFWATWCAPCIGGFPALSDLQREYADEGVIVVALSDEPLETVQPFLDRPFRDTTHGERMDFVVATDPDASVRTGVLEAMSEYSIPQSVVIDRDGTIVWIGHPEVDGLEGALERILAGSYDLEAWRETFESRRAFGKQFAALLEQERWQEAADLAGDEWSRLNDIAWRITLNQGGAIENRDLDLADRLAAEAFAMSGETETFSLHIRAAIAFERGEIDRAVELEQRALDLSPPDGNWTGYYRQTLARYEAARQGD